MADQAARIDLLKLTRYRKIDSAGRTMIVESESRSKSSLRTRNAFVVLPATGSGAWTNAALRRRSILFPAAGIELKLAIAWRWSSLRLLPFRAPGRIEL